MPPLKNSSEELVTEDRDKAELLNLQFKENFSREDDSHIPFYNCAWPRMPAVIVSEHGMLQLLTGLKTSKAVGTDEIHPRVLRGSFRTCPCSKVHFSKILRQWITLYGLANGKHLSYLQEG